MTVLVLVVLAAISFIMGRYRSRLLAANKGGIKILHSLPKHYGYMAAIWAAIPAIILLAMWIAFEPGVIRGMVVESLPAEIQQLPKSEIGLYYNQLVSYAKGHIDATNVDKAQVTAAGYYNSLLSTSHILKATLVIILSVMGGMLALRRISPSLRARNHVENVVQSLLFICSFIAVLTTLGIVLSVLLEALRFFEIIPITDFIFGLEWSPQMAIRTDQVGASGSFGFLPLFIGTLLISLVAMLIAVPIGLMSAIYMSEFASMRFRSVTKPVREVLAGVPTVV